MRRQPSLVMCGNRFQTASVSRTMWTEKQQIRTGKESEPKPFPLHYRRLPSRLGV
ncbi:hypothetical protein [Neisseria zoodegmatis]|uniref:hypothetical protein n=1 Tax=Neisseria zoodegmatis TaxID=326523 RepID=UPI0015F0C222|nr:hypothetical protein [Neisseria zoodegmatis]